MASPEGVNIEAVGEDGYTSSILAVKSGSLLIVILIAAKLWLDLPSCVPIQCIRLISLEDTSSLRDNLTAQPHSISHMLVLSSGTSGHSRGQC